MFRKDFARDFADGEITHEGANVMPEGRVDPPVVIELESRRPIGSGDLVKEPVPEEEPMSSHTNKTRDPWRFQSRTSATV